MEIKCVKKEKMAYPKINEITDKRIKDSIPDKWLKFGTTSFLLNILMQSKVLAVSPDDVIMPIAGETAGIVSEYYMIYRCIKGISLLSTLTLLVSGIIIIIKRSKARKQGKNIKVSKEINTVFLLSVIVLILSGIGYLITKYFEYSGH